MAFSYISIHVLLPTAGPDADQRQYWPNLLERLAYLRGFSCSDELFIKISQNELNIYI